MSTVEDPTQDESDVPAAHSVLYFIGLFLGLLLLFDRTMWLAPIALGCGAVLYVVYDKSHGKHVIGASLLMLTIGYALGQAAAMG